MIVDAHTHIFPPAFIEQRDDYLRDDPTFAELYSNPRAQMASAEQLLAAMDVAAVNVAVVCGFAWQNPRRCREHNDYLLRCAEASGGRLLPFCSLPLSDAAAARAEVLWSARGGARGLGELRPESQGVRICDPSVAELLAWAVAAHELPLLVHASEPVGHAYPGKHGQSLGPLYEFIRDHEEVRLIAAHWGGGLPFYALMPEVRVALANVWVDTAASPLLYDDHVYRTVADLIGPERILFGSDYPLLRPQGQIDAIRRSPLAPPEQQQLLGDNAARLFRLGTDFS